VIPRRTARARSDAVIEGDVGAAAAGAGATAGGPATVGSADGTLLGEASVIVVSDRAKVSGAVITDPPLAVAILSSARRSRGDGSMAIT
jgi:hypothetical protein